MKTRPAWLAKWTGERLHPAVIGAALLVFGTAGFQAFVVEPGEAQLQSLREALVRRVQSVRPENLPADRAHASGDQLQAFYAFFRRDFKLSDWLARIYDVADRAGVRPQRGDYRLLDGIDAPLLRYEVALALSGDYRKIRSFAEGVLNTVPVASLDHIVFRRQGALQDEVEAELRFTLYVARLQ